MRSAMMQFLKTTMNTGAGARSVSFVSLALHLCVLAPLREQIRTTRMSGLNDRMKVSREDAKTQRTTQKTPFQVRPLRQAQDGLSVTFQQFRKRKTAVTVPNLTGLR